MERLYWTLRAALASMLIPFVVAAVCAAAVKSFVPKANSQNTQSSQEQIISPLPAMLSTTMAKDGRPWLKVAA